MKKYSALTFLTGVFLVAGVLFTHFYAGSNAPTDAIAMTQQVATMTGTTDANGTKTGLPSGTTAAKAAGTTIGSSGSAGSGPSSSTGTPASGPGSSNGTYSGSANYRTPEGTENIGVTLTIANGVVTDASLTNSGYARESVRYQNAFASSYRSYVIGRSLASLRLSRVSGASLTTNAFNSAVAQISSKAS